MRWTVVALAVLALGACGAEGAGPVAGTLGSPGLGGREVESLAAMERRQGWRPGWGEAEARLREAVGDVDGAAWARRKDARYAWNYGEGADGGEVGAAASAVDGETEGFDDFSRFVRVAGRIDRGEAEVADRDAWEAMQARYALLPEYWYWTMRLYGPGVLGRHAAERALDLYGANPWQEELRAFLAREVGLGTAEGRLILTRAEMEARVQAAVQAGNPELLAPLVDLLEAKDNDYTLFALGALRGLAADPAIRAWLEVRRSSARGLVADRLAYVVGS